MRANRLMAEGKWLVLVTLAGFGCQHDPGPPAAVSFSISPILKDSDGIVKEQETPIQIESAVVDEAQEFSLAGRTYFMHIRKTQYGKSTFEITFPDKSVHMVLVKAGEPKDVIPKGQKMGIRIAVEESR